MDAFEAIADPVRRRIVEQLASGALSAGQVARAFGEISRPAVSRHLRILREAGLVEAEEQGRQRIYRACPDALDEVGRWLQGLRPPWEQHLDALHTEVVRTRRERSRASAVPTSTDATTEKTA